LAASVKFLGAIAQSELLKMYEDGAVTAVILASIDLGNGLHEGNGASDCYTGAPMRLRPADASNFWRECAL